MGAPYLRPRTLWLEMWEARTQIDASLRATKDRLTHSPVILRTRAFGAPIARQ